MTAASRLRTLTSRTLGAIVTVACLSFAATTAPSAQARQQQARQQPPRPQQPPTAPPTRTSPPAAFACDPNHLTSYAGIVQRYARDEKHVLIVVHTDWDTTEAVDIKPASPTPVAERAMSMFRIDGRAFTPDDWTRIEQSPGTLRAGTRATIWACDNGRTSIEWNTPREE